MARRLKGFSDTAWRRAHDRLVRQAFDRVVFYRNQWAVAGADADAGSRAARSAYAFIAVYVVLALAVLFTPAKAVRALRRAR